MANLLLDDYRNRKFGGVLECLRSLVSVTLVVGTVGHDERT